MLDEARKQGWLGDVRTILRILFEPYAMMFLDDGNIAYIKLISSYTNHIRPRGLVQHPADYPGSSYPSLHEAVSLLKERLSFLDEHRFDQRAETVSAMFYGAFIQFAARDPKLGFDKYRLYEDTLEMMAAAIAAPMNRPG
jgi:predicted O-methyltransferase YrrM